MGSIVRGLNGTLEQAFGVRVQRTNVRRRRSMRTYLAAATRPGAGEMPTVVSFFGGKRYYYDAAESLRGDCERLGLAYHLEEVDVLGRSWPEICRLKIGFYRRMHERYGAILWIDIDDRLMSRPDALAGCKLDMAGFGGRLRYIRDYDPYKVTRFWVPSILFFGATDRARRFIDAMGATERSTPDDVTDDWVLHETWMNHSEPLNVALLSPRLVARELKDVTPDTVFLHGDSGHVPEFREKVVQHQRRLDDRNLRGHALAAESLETMKAGDRVTARLLAARAYKYLPDDSEVAIRYAHYLRFGGMLEESIEVLEGYAGRHPGAPDVREALVKSAIARHDFVAAEENLSVLVANADTRVRARAESLAYELDLDRRAHERAIPASSRTKMWWMRTPYPGNFGDVLSPWIVEQVTGIPPLFGPRDRSLLAIGSIIKYATPKSTVWGSGTPRLEDALNADAKYRAVRGPITREVVLSSGGSCPPVYGDPGLLLPRFLPRTNRQPSYRLGLIRHVNHQSRPMRLDGVKDISLYGVGPAVIERVVDEILDCEAVLSTSLHGIIIANAYGVPARWCFFSDDRSAIAGDGTKYEDYFRSVGVMPQVPLDLAGFSIVDERLAARVDGSVDLRFDEEALIGAFPG